MQQGNIEIYQRDIDKKEYISLEHFLGTVETYLYEMQKRMLTKHEDFTKKHIYHVDTYQEFKEKITDGFVVADWDGDVQTAMRIKEETTATIRCLWLPEYDSNLLEKMMNSYNDLQITTTKQQLSTCVYS